MRKTADEHLEETRPPDLQEERARNAVAYLDLWERNNCLQAIHGRMQGLSCSRGSGS